MRRSVGGLLDWLVLILLIPVFILQWLLLLYIERQERKR